MLNPDEHIPAMSAPAPRNKLRAQRNSRRSPRRRLVIVVLILSGIGVGGWYLGRPYLLFREAKSILTTDPQKAASLLEEVVASQGDSFPDAQVLWSRALLRSGRWEEAIGCFSQIGSVTAIDSGDLIALAEDAHAANTPFLEVMALEAVQSTDSRRAAATIRLIELRQKAGDVRRTMLLAEELIKLRPRESKGWLAKANVHEQTMQLPDAASSYKTALECELSNDQRAGILRSLVRLLTQFGDITNARIYQNQLTECIQPLSIVDRINEARLLRMEGNIPKAQIQINDVLSQAPENPDALELSGTTAMEQSDYETAILHFSKLIRIQPRNKLAHYKLGQVLSRLGQTEKAASHFNENRRLLAFSTRIVELQRQEKLSAEERDELIHAMEQMGMHSMADEFRTRSP